ncbi:TetR/AcrR family transcriptional regulator [Nocardia panacis]|uniref:TetR/AcrR family transcriptional regulator n=1 Tax=Nocardia panacis TaxID=2340916 RepID=A0A3A4KKB0_9NOCA|nr:TetR/AcrR family transcriptional regulator [Nocardia panacis]RJO73417.1 TetR/AcrR family transcriptional regulator [Nocardia panacis]
MPTTPRARARAQTMTDIVRIGRDHLASHGAAALSLRAVARDLGVVSSAVYRYVSSRDELLTLLVVDGYTDLGDAVDAALDAAPADPIERIRVLGRAVREWALSEPARYGLLFGTPVPGYQAPAEQTVAPGIRVVVTLMGLIDAAYRQGVLAEPTRPVTVPESLAGNFAGIRAEFGLDLPDWLIARGITAWSSLFGAVNFDVFDMYGADTFADRAEVYELHLDAILDLLGYRGGV